MKPFNILTCAVALLTASSAADTVQADGVSPQLSRRTVQHRNGVVVKVTALAGGGFKIFWDNILGLPDALKDRWSELNGQSFTLHDWGVQTVSGLVGHYKTVYQTLPDDNPMQGMQGPAEVFGGVMCYRQGFDAGTGTLWNALGAKFWDFSAQNTNAIKERIEEVADAFAVPGEQPAPMRRKRDSLNPRGYTCPNYTTLPLLMREGEVDTSATMYCTTDFCDPNGVFGECDDRCKE